MKYPKMNMNITRRYTGLVPFCRSFSLLFRGQGSMANLFGIYCLFVLQADWDPRHKETFTNIPTNSDLSKILLLSSSTISRAKKRLEKMGLIETVNNVSRIKYYSFFRYPLAAKLSKENGFSDPQQVIAYMNDIDALMKEDIANMQQDELENDDSFSFPFKDDLVSFDNRDIGTDINMDEMDRAISEMNINEKKVRNY